MTIPTPETMNAKSVIEIAQSRGFKVLLKEQEPPMPVLRGDPNEVTPALLEALSAFRTEIIEELRRA